MISWQTSRIAKLLGVADPGSSATFDSVSTDTRSLQPGALFVALVGDRFDGHDYIDAAAAKGAAGAVVRRGAPETRGLVRFEVDDTLAALGSLARARRREIEGPVVAVTGTNGKTATKEMLSCALKVRWSVHATRANLNNVIGVPLTILGAPAECDALVVEAGASEPGEIARLRAIVEPTVGVVTNVGQGHLMGLGSLEGVLTEKTALLAGVPLAVVGTDPPSLAARARRLARKVVTAGLAEGADFSPDSWCLDDHAHGSVRVDGVEAHIPLVGYHQLENLMVALAVARELGLDLNSAAARLRDVRLPPGRCEVLTTGSRTVIHDAYNSNPGSLRALIRTALAMANGRPLVFVLGTMLELGATSRALHAELAAEVMETHPYIVAALGEFIPAFDRFAAELGERLIVAEDAESLGRQVAAQLSGGEFVLVKASHGVHLETAIPFLISTEGSPCSTTS